MSDSHKQSRRFLRQGQNSNSGQIIVEYVLMLVVAVSIAALITRVMVSRNPEDPGILTSTWSRINQTIGFDFASDSGAPSNPQNQ